MDTVLIAGATGFIGRALTQRFCLVDKQVYALDLPGSEKRMPTHPNITFIPCDLQDRQELTEILKCYMPDVVYHLAWDGVSTDVKNDMHRQLSNIPITLGLMSACREAGCSHIIIPGSASEYAYCGQTVNGDNAPAPGDAYAACKAAIQTLCQWYARQHEMHLNWLLIGSIYGPGRNDSNILTYTIKALLHGEPTAFSPLEQLWDYIYIDDLIEALYLLADHGKPDTVYPIGSGQAAPLASYIKKVQQQIDPNAPLGIGKLPYKFGSKPDNSVIDIGALTRDTGFRPKVSFDEGLSRTIEYFRQQEK